MFHDFQIRRNGLVRECAAKLRVVFVAANPFNPKGAAVE
jgi:hypothetical protein